MKKFLIIASVVAICAATVFTITSVSNRSDSMEKLFNANVEALADTEMSVAGHCQDSNNYNCLARCPQCGNLWEGVGHYAPAYNVTGTCTCGFNGAFVVD